MDSHEQTAVIASLVEYRLKSVEARLDVLVAAESKRADERSEHLRAFVINSIMGPVAVGTVMLVVQHFWR